MKIERIVVDLDDVLNTFTLDTMRFKGINIESYDEFPIDYPCIRTAIALMKGKEENEKEDLAQFWDSIPRQVWSNAALAPEFQELLDWCMRHADYEGVPIATTPTKCAECMAGKYEWIERHMPRSMQRSYAITPRKWWLRRPDTLLLDDMESNCKKFEAGPFPGRAILVPRPWNRNRGCDVMETIKEEFEAM